MSTSKGDRISLKLTPRQQEEIRAVTGKVAESIELSIEELEARIAPSMGWGNN
jgi:hypothetical protein